MLIAGGDFERTAFPKKSNSVLFRQAAVTQEIVLSRPLDPLPHNLGIAGALNYLPVSKMFILVKAETRLDSVVDNIRKYSDRFVEFDPDILGVLITHMDTVSWSPTR